uniref:FAF domain-containing protein n=1 Tax=Kalanchoe fedtschenkoi TaxID=63787 RepID=A0A7N0ZYP4_KALFE
MSSSAIDARVSTRAFPSSDHALSSCKIGGHHHASAGTSLSFLEALTDAAHNPKPETAAAVYVHPLVKKSSAKLSEKSLEMCTESLGSETGSDVTEEAMLNTPMMIRRKETKAVVANKTKRDYNDFPPPLTSMSNSVSVKSHRENGRLVMNAVVFMEQSNSLFHAERINGRLTLRLKKMGDPEKEDRIEQDEFETEDEIDETAADGGGGEDPEHPLSRDEDLSGNTENVEGNIGIDENISRLGRCNEAGGDRRGSKGRLWNMETCWVAT